MRPNGLMPSLRRMKPRLSWDATAEITRSNAVGRQNKKRRPCAGVFFCSDFPTRWSNPQSTREGYQPSGPLLGACLHAACLGASGWCPAMGARRRSSIGGVLRIRVHRSRGRGAQVRPDTGRTRVAPAGDSLRRGPRFPAVVTGGGALTALRLDASSVAERRIGDLHFASHDDCVRACDKWRVKSPIRDGGRRRL